VLIHINACDRGLAHADAGSAVAGDDAAEELEEIRVVSDEEDVLAIGAFVNELLEVGIAGAEVESGADFDFAVVAEFIANELGSLKGAL